MLSLCVLRADLNILRGRKWNDSLLKCETLKGRESTTSIQRINERFSAVNKNGAKIKDMFYRDKITKF